MEDMNYGAFWKFILLMNENDLLQHVELIGSWCEYLYEQSGYLTGFHVGLRTLDIDFLVKNKRRPNNKVNLSEIAEENGFTIDQDAITGATKIYSPDLIEIEFLIGKMGAGVEQVLDTNIGVNAQTLRHTSILADNSMEISLNGMKIVVPKPEAYVVHKMIINKQRKPDKQIKDQEAILRLIPFLNTKVLSTIIMSLSRKEKKEIIDFCKVQGIDLGCEII